MTVNELITELKKADGESRVFMGYDGNIVVTEPYSVEIISDEKDIGNCWWSVKLGATVIMCDEG